MKNKILYITLLLFGLFSCASKETYQKSEKVYLRQLVKTDEVSKTASASYFLVMGSASYSEDVETKIKLMGKVNGLYRLIEFNFNDVRIKIDNKIAKPYLYLIYYSNKKRNVSALLGYREWDIIAYVIVCPEKYLPEQLLPIKL